MIRPNPIDQERFADTGAHQVADHGDYIGLAFGQETRDGITVLFIVERDAFDGAAQRLEGHWRESHAEDHSAGRRTKQDGRGLRLETPGRSVSFYALDSLNNKKRKPETYYRCDWRHHAGKEACPQRTIATYVVHDAIADWFAGHVLSFERLSSLRSQIESAFGGNQTMLLSQRDQIRTEIAVIKRKIGRLLASIENGTDGPDLRELIQQRRREQATQEVRLADLEAQLGMGKVRISDEVLRFMSSQIGAVFAARGEGARALLRAVIDRAEVRDGEIKIHYAPEAVMDLFLLDPQSVTNSVPPREFLPKHTFAMGGLPRHTIEAEIEFARPAKSRYRIMATWQNPT